MSRINNVFCRLLIFSFLQNPRFQISGITRASNIVNPDQAKSLTYTIQMHARLRIILKKIC